MNTMHLLLLSLRMVMLCHYSSTTAKDHLLVIFHGSYWPLCADVPVNNPHSFIHSFIQSVVVVGLSVEEAA